MDDVRKPDDPEAAAQTGRGDAAGGETNLPRTPASEPPPPPFDERDAGSPEPPERDRGISDFVRRAVSAGVGAASRSKDDIMRVAAGEVRTWLEHLDVNNELLRTLSKMVIEVKTEIRFRPTEDGKIAPEAVNDVKVKGPPR